MTMPCHVVDPSGRSSTEASMTGATTLNHVRSEEQASWIPMIALALG
jgi:hypothetical protein